MEGIDLEQVNALRAKLGIQPIPTPGSNGLQFKDKGEDGSDQEEASTHETRQAAAGDNWLQLQAEQEAKDRRLAQKLQIKKQRDAAQRIAKLKGRGLGDLDEDEDLEDATSWLLKSKKRQKKLEKERQKRLEAELAEREKQAEYTTSDLSGLKVAHEIDQFGEEGDQILTLKDTTVGDDEDEDDELEDLDLREKEKLQERLKSKKRKFAYDPNATTEGSGLLSQYDDVIDGKKRIQISLDDIQKQATTPDVTMNETDQEGPKMPEMDRKRKKRRMRAAELARQLRDGDSNAPEDEEVGLIIDETTEFVSSLRTSTAQKKETRASAATQPEPAAIPALKLEADKQPKAEPMRSPSPPPETDAMDVDLPKPTEPAIQEVEKIHDDLGEEENLNKGMGAVLGMLTSRGILNREAEEDKNGLLRDRQRFLSEKKRREEDAERKARLQRERDRQSGKLDRMSVREREDYARNLNAQRDQAESRQMADIFNREYKPDVQLKYVDEYGRRLDAKEAFKHLSHQFHGKGSGKGKTEKRLKKIDDEKKKEGMSLLDTSRDTGGMDNAAQNRAKTNRQAGVRLQ
ncbi:hypothetical protein P152DRAFT_458472 [Eremomyces bilateralis CBS 781.70]|uniref:SART-1 protein n=1 Tax=Eremomyces bilateralis CBS 781.70 TaxID=1392243 RepID=A0A6G1G3H1_9PEZI|nr:uncharacterized protein P152DRAFT_458472 [Eremomyces bilateralis CBS 781.70]KAF1812657.1 hypothetical protein P152DRAFT_458472 [Eremomyces bilateralis CBS 781.70]